MEKSIEQANESLLKKQKQNQEGKEPVLQRLNSLIDAGEIGRARSLVIKSCPSWRSSEEKDIIVQLFKQAESATFTCPQCERLAEYRFNPIFLRYDTAQQNCDDCNAAIAQVAKAQKLIDKKNAAKKWKDDVEVVADAMIVSAGVPEDFQSASMGDLAQSMSKALTTGTSYFIKGDVGVGKSHLSVVLMREHIKTLTPEYDEQRKAYFMHDYELQQPMFIEVPELLLRIRDTYNDSNNETEKDIVDLFSRTPFLVLDDLGSEKASEFSTLMLYLIINRRCTSGKTTIITSNLDIDEIRDRLSERISSRIKGMCRILNMTGDDKRYTNKREQGYK